MPATVEELSPGLMERALGALGSSYQTLEEGAYLVPFPLGNGAAADRLLVIGQISGDYRDVYQLSMHTERTFPRDDWWKLVDICNTWNATRRWPKAIAKVRPEGDVELTHREDFWVGVGVHLELLANYTDLVVEEAASFWRWLREDHEL